MRECWRTFVKAYCRSKSFIAVNRLELVLLRITAARKCGNGVTGE